MDGFMPSEIARLVLGYLKEVKCDETYKAFLSENWDLQEYQRQLSRGKEYPTTYAGKSLLSILDEYYQLKVKGETSSSSFQSEPSTSLCKSPANKAQSSVVVRTQQTLTKSVVSSVRKDENSPVQQTSPVKRVLPPRNLLSPPDVISSKSRVPSVPWFKTPKKKQSSGTFRSSIAASTEGHQTESTQKLPLASASKSGVSVSDASSISIREQEESSRSESTAATTTTSSLYINSSVQTCLSFTSTQTDSDHETSYSSQTAPTTTASSEVNQNVNSPDISAGTGNTPSSAGNLEGKKLSESMCDHANDPTEKLPDNRCCSGSDTASAALGNEQSCSAVPSSSETSAVTPDVNHGPPPYQRAPATNSPRITLSLERSAIPSLSTPVKQVCGTDNEFRSLSSRKKSSIPRRRLISGSSPLSKSFPQTDVLAPMLGFPDEASDYWDRFEQTFMPLISKLAENINIVNSNEENSGGLESAKPGQVSPAKPSCNEETVPSSRIKNIMDLTESDPVFEEYVALLSEKLEASREDCDVNMMFLSPFRRGPTTPCKERNASSVARKLLISGDQNQAPGMETSRRQCSDSLANQQQLGNREIEAHTSSQCLYDGGGNIAHSTGEESSGHPWKNAFINTHQQKEADQSDGQAKNVVGSQQNALPPSNSVDPQCTSKGFVESSAHDSGPTGDAAEAQKTADLSSPSYDMSGSCGQSPNTHNIIKENSVVSSGTVPCNTDATVTDSVSSQNQQAPSDNVSANNTLGDICKAAGIFPFNSPPKLQNQTSPQYTVVSTTPVKWQTGTSSPKYKSYKLSIAEDSRSTPSVIFVPQNTSEVNAVPGGASAYLIIHTAEGNISSGINPQPPPPPPPALPPCAQVEMVTIRENQVVTENSLVPVVSSVPPTQPFSVVSSNTSNETYWVPDSGSPSVNLASDIQYVTVVSPGEQIKVSNPIPIAMAPPGHKAERNYYPLKKKGRAKVFLPTKDDPDTARIRANILRDLNLGKKKAGRPRRSKRGNRASQTAFGSTVTVNSGGDHIPTSNRLTPVKCATPNEVHVPPKRNASTKRTQQHEEKLPSPGSRTRAKHNQQQNSPSKCSTPSRGRKQRSASDSPVNKEKQNTGKSSPSKRGRSAPSPKSKTSARVGRALIDGKDLRSSVVANFDALKKNRGPKLKSLISSVRHHLENPDACVRALDFGIFADEPKPLSPTKKEVTNREPALARGRTKRTLEEHSRGKETASEELIICEEQVEVIDLASSEESPARELVLSVPRLDLTTQDKTFFGHSLKSLHVLQSSALSSETDKSPLKKRVLKSHAREILRQQQISSNSDKVEDVEKELPSLSSSTETLFNPASAVEQTDLDSHDDEFLPVLQRSEFPPEVSGLCSKNLSAFSSERTNCNSRDEELSQKEMPKLVPMEKVQDTSAPMHTKQKTSTPTAKKSTKENQTFSESHALRSPRKETSRSPLGTRAASKEQTVAEPSAQESPTKETVPCSPIQGTVEEERGKTTALYEQTTSKNPSKDSLQEEIIVPTRQNARSRKEEITVPPVLRSHSSEKAASETPSEELHQKEKGKPHIRQSEGLRKEEEIISLSSRLHSCEESISEIPHEESLEKEDKSRTQERRPEKVERRGRPRKEQRSQPSSRLHSCEKSISEIPHEESLEKEDKSPTQERRPEKVERRGRPRKEQRSQPKKEQRRQPKKEQRKNQPEKVERRLRPRKAQTTVSVADCSHSLKNHISDSHCKEVCERRQAENEHANASSEKDFPDSHEKQSPNMGQTNKEANVSHTDGSHSSDSYCRKSPGKRSPREEQRVASLTGNSCPHEEHISNLPHIESPRIGHSRKEPAKVSLACSSHSSEENESDSHQEESSKAEQLRKQQKSASLTKSSHSSEKDVFDSRYNEMPESMQLIEEQTPVSPKDRSHSFENLTDVQEHPRKEQVTLAESLQSSGKATPDLWQKESPPQEPQRKERIVSFADSSQSPEKPASTTHLPREEIFFRSPAMQSGTLRKSLPPGPTLYSRRLLHRIQQEEEQEKMKADKLKNRSPESHFRRKHINQTRTAEKIAPKLRTSVSPLDQNKDTYSAGRREFQSNENKTQQRIVSSCKNSRDEGTIVNNLDQSVSVSCDQIAAEKAFLSGGEKTVPKFRNEVSENVHLQDSSEVFKDKTVNMCCLCCRKINEISEKLSQSVNSTPSGSSIKFVVTTGSLQMESACTQTENSLDGDNVKRFTSATSMSPCDNRTAEGQMLDSASQCLGMDDDDDEVDQCDAYKGEKSKSKNLKGKVRKEGPEKTKKKDRARQSRINEEKVNQSGSSKTGERNPVERRGRKRKEPPPIPAGVKLPPKWGVSSISVYSDALNHVISPYPSKRRKCTQNEKDQEQPSGKKKLTAVNEDLEEDECYQKSPLENEAVGTTRKRAGTCQLVYSSDESLSQTPENLVQVPSYNNASVTATERDPPPRRIAVPSAHVHTDSLSIPPQKCSDKHSSASPSADSSPKPSEDYNEVECAIAFLKETELQSDRISFEARDSLSEVGCELTIGKSPSSEPVSSCNSSSIFNVGDTNRQKASSSEKKKKEEEAVAILKEISISEFLDEIHV